MTKRVVDKSKSPSKSNAKVVSTQTLDTFFKVKPEVKEVMQSREVQEGSGQTELANELFIASTTIVEVQNYLTPFDFVKSTDDLQCKGTNATENKIKEASIIDKMPICPKCQSVMIKRIAKKGARQGQVFYGCSQFTKCCSIMNVE